ncbi:MAG: hypothetical protein FIA97_06145 [Methylococcaceae bacterium]|nr:hypothetical protein [Methylococcaceae bacterium]
MRPNHIQLLTPLTPAQCVERLTAVVDLERSGLFSGFGGSGVNPVIGEVTESTLRLRKRIGYRNSFQTLLTATLRPGAEGTVVSGDLGIHPVIRTFMFVWFAIVIVTGAPAYLGLFGPVICGPAMVEENAWIGLLIPPAMLVFGLVAVTLGRRLARQEAAFLMEFLIRNLDARERNP